MKIKILVLLVFVLFMPINVHAEKDDIIAHSNIAEKIEQISDWFWKLVDEYDQIVEKEQQKQFLRYIDKLRGNLYALEQATRKFVLKVPVNPPTAQEKLVLLDDLDELSMLLKEVIESLNDIGPEIRQVHEEAEFFTYEAIATRGGAIRKARQHLRDVIENPQSWDRDSIAEGFVHAINKIIRAQRRFNDDKYDSRPILLHR